MSGTADQQRKARREVERIRSLLLQHGGREYDASREDEHYEGGFEIQAGREGRPHSVGGFHIDPFGVWPPKMQQHAETLTSHGYQVKIRDYFDGQILEVTPPTPQPWGSGLLRLFRAFRT